MQLQAEWEREQRHYAEEQQRTAASTPGANLQPRPGPDALRTLANTYQQAAGAAFAQGRDADATAYRQAAADLRDLADRLPVLTPAHRLTARGL